MKVTVINGNARHGSTWHCMDALKQELSLYGEVETKEFSLPKDMPHFCNGCFSCFFNGEHTCPHLERMTPIKEAILEADVVILTSPVYAMDVTGQMKALLDHLCYMWMSHRPNPNMFKKVGVTVATTAGAGLGHTTKTMRNSLKFWGVKSLFSYKNAVSAMKWNDVKPEKQDRIKQDIAAMAKQIAKAAQKAERPLFRSFFFKLMTGMMKKNTWNLTDRKHWEDNGWLSGAKPF
jgi:multimeric flavodoxin WrbA